MSKTWTLLLVASLACACAEAPVVAVKPGYDARRVGRVALLDFADLSGRDGSGQTVSQALEPYLLKDGYSLVERSQVRRILQQQAFDQSGLVSPQATEALGRLLSVEAVVLGTVTSYVAEFSKVYMQNVRNVSYEPVYETMQVADPQGGTRAQTVLSHYDVVTTNESVPATYSTPATVAFSARLVDAATGEVLWTGSTSADGSTLASAAGSAAKRLMGALKKAAKS